MMQASLGEITTFDEQCSRDRDRLLQRVETAVLEAQQSGMDLSLLYDEGTPSYLLQQSLRLSTRALHSSLTMDLVMGVAIPDDAQVIQSLSLLDEARKVYGSHPFHYVLEGRLAHVAQQSMWRGKTIPELLRHWLHFNIKDYHCPSLNYNTPQDIINSVNAGNDRSLLKYLPPEWGCASKSK